MTRTPRPAVWGLAALALAGLAAAAAGEVGAAADLPDPLRPEDIPPRPATAVSGSQFAQATVGLRGPERQRRALEELRQGNLPEFLRTFVAVRLESVAAADTLRAVIWVAPDYLAIGDAEDFLRIPLTYPMAAAIAGEFGCVLPTPKMVDAIYAQAAVQLSPAPMAPGPRMRSSDYYLRHQRTIEAQRAARGAPDGALTAGHKKDVVLSNRLQRKRDRIAIYGWHRPGGVPIQPLSTAHVARYADYSHGVRLVYGRAWMAGRWRPLAEVLTDTAVARVLTYEGIIARPRQLPSGWRPVP